MRTTHRGTIQVPFVCLALVFGFHYIYTFDSLAGFLGSIGSPDPLSLRAFNVGPNLTAESGGGDDLASQPVVWPIN